MKIWAVCKDPGGTNGVLPVVDELISRGHEVLLAANGKAVEILPNLGRPFQSWEGRRAEEIMAEEKIPQVMITSICTGGGIGRDLTPLLRAVGVKTIALQDIWVGGLAQESSWLNIRPDFTTTNDEFGKELTLNLWPDFNPAKIVVTGFPAFDKYTGMDFESVGRGGKEKLGLESGIPVVSFFGGGIYTSECLKLLVEALDGLGEKTFLIPRPHPRTPQNFRDEMIPWQKVLSGMKWPNLVVDFFGQCDNSELVGASDIICATNSTVLVDAAVMRKPAVSIMGSKMKKWFIENQKPLIHHPLVGTGAALAADDFSTLIRTLVVLLDHPNVLQKSQERAIRIDGKSASRVADLVESLA